MVKDNKKEILNSILGFMQNLFLEPEDLIWAIKNFEKITTKERL